MENRINLVDDYVQALKAMPAATTDAFFYTRLVAKMEQKANFTFFNFSLKPIWVASVLCLLLCINGYFLVTETKQTVVANTSITIENCASFYDQSLSTY